MVGNRVIPQSHNALWFLFKAFCLSDHYGKQLDFWSSAIYISHRRRIAQQEYSIVIQHPFSPLANTRFCHKGHLLTASSWSLIWHLFMCAVCPHVGLSPKCLSPCKVSSDSRVLLLFGSTTLCITHTIFKQRHWTLCLSVFFGSRVANYLTRFNQSLVWPRFAFAVFLLPSVCL